MEGRTGGVGVVESTKGTDGVRERKRRRTTTTRRRRRKKVID